jgi:hypothetical protein
MLHAPSLPPRRLADEPLLLRPFAVPAIGCSAGLWQGARLAKEAVEGGSYL